MWKLGNFWTSTSTSMTSNLTTVHDVHVLLVDHDSEGLINTAKLLEMCQYRVTLAELASVAITMLLNGKTKFDIVMANINSPDLHGFKLLQQTVNMKIPIILMSVDDNTFMTLKAIEDGAFLCIKKPPTIEMVRCLWQHVVRERLRMETSMAANYSARGVEFREAILQVEDNPNNIGVGNMFMTKDSEKSTKKMRGGKGANEEEYDSRTRMPINNKIKRKVCTEWTADLHEKFMNAIAQLGEGRCFPKEILELMNVPGLTRMQVASHLQKCRNNNWRSPHERKSNLSVQDGSCDTNGSHYKSRRFGSMPRLGKASQDVPVQETDGVGQGSKIHFEPEMPNDGGTNFSNSRHPYDDFFNFPEMDNLISNFSGLPQGSTGMKNSIPISAGLHANPIYREQNSTVPSVDTKSQYSETSNFGSDKSETKEH